MIIFDLDDTILDTSGSVTPFKLKECLKRLIAEGLSINDRDQAYSELLSMSFVAGRSQDAITQFVLRRGGGDHLISFALEELKAPLPKNFTIRTTPEAKQILDSLKELCPLALVTGGHPPFQMEKLEKAGIDRSIFSRIAIAEDSIKKPFYEGLLKEFSLLPHQVIVCGDRIAMDLLPAFELGLTTIHMRWGRGRQMISEKWINHSISDLRELKRIIEI